MKCPYCIKICSKCGNLLVAYDGNFTKQKTCKWGLDNRCKKCRNKYYNDNKEHIKEKSKRRYDNNKDVILEKCKEYRKNHKDKISKFQKEYYQRHKEEISEYKKYWYSENLDKIFNYHSKRRASEENQGNGISKEQWLEMMLWFDFCCAYSGEYIGDDSKHRTVDHIIPLSSGGEHEVWNCVPMYDSYNFSKHNNNMLEWYILQPFYSEERLNKIYEWIEYAEEKYKK